MAQERSLGKVEQIQALLAQGAVYVDVRSREEYLEGHVPGALNLPWMHGSLAGLVPNPEFEREFSEAISQDREVIVGCRSGQRARSAREVVLRLGYSVWLDELGFDGRKDAFGRLTPGWSRLGLPVERGE